MSWSTNLTKPPKILEEKPVTHYSKTHANCTRKIAKYLKIKRSRIHKTASLIYLGVNFPD